MKTLFEQFSWVCGEHGSRAILRGGLRSSDGMAGKTKGMLCPDDDVLPGMSTMIDNGGSLGDH